MNALQALVSLVPARRVKRFVLGVFHSAVQAEACGIASTLRSTEGRRHPGLGDTALLEDCTLNQLAELACSHNLLQASLGMAAINCAFAAHGEQGRRCNAKQLIRERGAGKTVALIGHFPFVEELTPVCRQLLVFEKEPQPGDLPETAIPQRLPGAEIVAVTATSLTNHSFDTIMAHCAPTAWVMLLGPSTPLAPSLFEYGVDVLCGVLCREQELVLQQVERAVPTRELRGVEQVILEKNFYCVEDCV